MSCCRSDTKWLQKTDMSESLRLSCVDFKLTTSTAASEHRMVEASGGTSCLSRAHLHLNVSLPQDSGSSWYLKENAVLFRHDAAWSYYDSDKAKQMDL